ncbi:unnamed protein product [Symbiodinium natans]|uniref:Uncharacterized protein n=1 Tax=Symbiodinium natans TaxID=878477 RepID=A0A812P8Q1_9DINO|nr:unnamed protein product [Symbiodinium natans]
MAGGTGLLNWFAESLNRALQAAESGGYEDGETGKGITYRTVKECADREVSRALSLGREKFKLEKNQVDFKKMQKIGDRIAKSLPDFSVGIGSEVVTKPAQVANAAFQKVMDVKIKREEFREHTNDREFALADATWPAQSFKQGLPMLVI